MTLRGHAHFVELVGRRSGPPWWVLFMMAALVAAATVFGHLR